MSKTMSTKTTDIKTGITKAKSGHFTAWGKAAHCMYADATIPGLASISRAREHVEAMRDACANLDPTEHRAALRAYQQAHR